MVKECQVFLERSEYYPGQVINGTVECNFSSENTVRALRVRFKGKAAVHWSQGRNNHYRADETYFEMETDLLGGEKVIQEGQYKYPFSFNLPFFLPPSLSHTNGDIKYSARAIVDRPWAFDYQTKRPFTVVNNVDLNTIDEAKRPTELTKMKKPFSIFSGTGPIKIHIKLPVSGYITSQMIAFSAHVKNDSRITVRDVQFKLVQRLEFYCKRRSKTFNTVSTGAFGIIDSIIPPGSEKLWDLLELRVPQDVFIGDLNSCSVIKVFFELKGQVLLPFPHRNLDVTIPLTLGHIPLINWNQS